MAKKKNDIEQIDPPVNADSVEVENAQPAAEPPPEPEPQPAAPAQPAPQPALRPSARAAEAQRQAVKDVTGMSYNELVARIQQLESVVQNVAARSYENERLNAMTEVIEKYPDLWDAENKRFLFDTIDKNPEEILKAAEQANALLERGKVKVLSEYEQQFAQLRGMRPAPMTQEAWQEKWNEAKAKRDTGMMQAILEALPEGVRITQ